MVVSYNYAIHCTAEKILDFTRTPHWLLYSAPLCSSPHFPFSMHATIMTADNVSLGTMPPNLLTL